MKIPLYKKEYFSKRYRLSWRTWYKMFDNPYKIWKVRRERAKYGVAKYDAWSFHDYLEKVLANGLAQLADEKSGVPMSFVSDPMGHLTDEDIASWDKVIRQMAEDAEWLATFDDKEFAVYEQYFTDEDGFTSIPVEDGKYYTLVEKRNMPERDIAWRKANKELSDERTMRKDRLFDLMKKHFFDLWD